jgi:hypothetical protein
MQDAQGAIEAFGQAARELRHAELTWHYERISVLARMNAGEFAYARTRLFLT